MKVKKVKTPAEYEYVEVETPWYYDHALDSCTFFGMITEDTHYQLCIRHDHNRRQIEIDIEPTDEGDACYFTEEYKVDVETFRNALWEVEECIHAVKQRLQNEKVY